MDQCLPARAMLGIVAVALAVGCGSSSGAPHAAAPQPKHKPANCASQIAAWAKGKGGTAFAVLDHRLKKLDDSMALAPVTPAQVTALRADLAAVQAHPAPPCLVSYSQPYWNSMITGTKSAIANGQARHGDAAVQAVGNAWEGADGMSGIAQMKGFNGVFPGY